MFVTKGLLRDPADLYSLDFQRASEVMGFQVLTVKCVRRAVEECDRQLLARLLAGLGIPGIGSVKAESLAEEFGTFDSFIAASEDDLADTKGISSVIAATVRSWLDEPQQSDLIDDLRSGDDERISRRVDALKGPGVLWLKNLRNAIESSKRQPLARLLFGLRIPEIGDTNAQILVDAFGDIDRIRDASQDDLAAVDGIGPVSAAAVRGWFDDPRSNHLLERFRAASLEAVAASPADGVISEDETPAQQLPFGETAVSHRMPGGSAAQLSTSADAPPAPGEQSATTAPPVPQSLAGKVVVVTGKLSGFTRRQVSEEILARGGKSSGNVSRRTTVLVTGSKPSAAKKRKAEECDVPVIDEDGFRRLLDTGTLP